MSELHAETVAFVRDTMLPPALPPARQRGVTLWLRENLFSGPLNTVLTIVALFVLWWLFQHFYPWFRHSVWNASSMAECRTLITERWGEGAGGGCFGLVRERWNQFIYGFYPSALYWRPTIVFGLMLFAVAPVLFSESRGLRWAVLGFAAVASFAAAVAVGIPPRAALITGGVFVLWAALIVNAAGYTHTSVALRDALTGLTAEQVIALPRVELGSRVRAAVAGVATDVGIIVDEVVVKDVVLPAEIRSAAAEVAVGRHRAQAQLEAARAQTAALRSLANGAKLLDDHPALARMRLVESLPFGAEVKVVLGDAAD